MKAELIELIDKRRTANCPHPPMSELVQADGTSALYCVECRVMGSTVHAALHGSFDPETFSGWFVFGHDDEWLEYEPTEELGVFVYLRQKTFNGGTYVRTFAVTSQLHEPLRQEADVVLQAGIFGIKYLKGEELTRGPMNRVFLISAAGVFMKSVQQCFIKALYDTSGNAAPKEG